MNTTLLNKLIEKICGDDPLGQNRLCEFFKHPFSSIYNSGFRSLWYNTKCLFAPFNVVKCAELPRSWCDRDSVMFHAMFQLIVDFVELEHPFKSWEDKNLAKRYTDRVTMRAWIEQHYNTEEGIRNTLPEWFSEEEMKSGRESQHRAYLKNIEILNLYEWYKDKKYELDTWLLAEKTGTKLEISEDGKLTRVSNGKPILISGEEYFQTIQEHDDLCDAMLERILKIRRYLWT